MANILTKKKQEIIVDLPYYDLDGYFNDFKVRSKYLYKIRTKDGKIVNYEPWEPQLVVDEIINQEIERTTRELGHVEVKLIYLKARQEGLSTDTTCRMSDLMLTHDNYNVQVLAHDRDGTETIYRQYRTLFNNLPHFVRVVDEKNRPIINNGAEWLMPVKPEGEPTNKQIMYKNMTHSYLGIQTAGKGDQGGKGGAINAVHYSENANYERHNDIISSTNQMIGGSHIFGVKESTANGVSGIGAGFYEDWVSESKAWKLYKEGKVSTFEGWRPVFIPWYWLMKYRKPLYQGKKIDISAVKWRSDKERREYLEWEELVENEIIPNDPYVDHERYDLRESTDFYRYVIIAKSQKELLRARRYYPTTPDEAFLTSDDCYFNTNHLHHVDIELEKKIEMPYLIGEITYKNEFEPTKTGELKLLKPPQKHWRHRYVLSCDQSKGYEGGDYSSITGFDRLEREFVMHWEGLIDEVELTDVYLRLLYYYNY
ncbi:MAG TPA: hypothetical protein VKA34_14235, partial [Balneolales bacterium]|nr:hypothetical protein [Balneolales bacterium]